MFASLVVLLMFVLVGLCLLLYRFGGGYLDSGVAGFCCWYFGYCLFGYLVVG